MKIRGSEVATLSLGLFQFSDEKYIGSAEAILSFRGELPSDFPAWKDGIINDIKRQVIHTLPSAKTSDQYQGYLNNLFGNLGTPILSSHISFSFAVENLFVHNLKLTLR